MNSCAEYFEATPAGQKKAETGVKGTLIFDANSKKVEFLNPKGAAAFSINYDAIRSNQACDKLLNRQSECSATPSEAFDTTQPSKRLDRARESKDQIRASVRQSLSRVSLLDRFPRLLWRTRKLGAAGRRSAIARR